MYNKTTQKRNMGKSKKYYYDWDDCEAGVKGKETMLADILADSEFPDLEELIIGCWGYDGEDCQNIIDGIVENADKFSHITKLFVGDMTYEECEVSWIEQGDYSRLWAAMPQLKELTIKGSNNLTLGDNIQHENLRSLTIICGGLGKNVIEEIQKAKFPNLQKLLLYIGVENYGFDGDEKSVEDLLKYSDFPKLSYLGITDSEMQDELTKVVLESKYINQITTLDLSNGTLSDKGGTLLLEKLPQLPNIKKVDLHYHYLSDDMMRKLKRLKSATLEIDLSGQEEAEEWDGEIWMDAMLTE